MGNLEEGLLKLHRCLVSHDDLESSVEVQVAPVQISRWRLTVAYPAEKICR